METLHKDEKRIRKINAFMRELTNAKPAEKTAIVNQYRDILDAIRPIDLFYVEAYRENTSLSVGDIKAQANRFVNVFRKGLSAHAMETHDHPFFAHLLEENNAVLNHMQGMKKHFKEGAISDHREALIKGFEACEVFEKKFVKKENILFPAIESKAPSTTPLKVMWSLHDDARALRKRILRGLERMDDETKLKTDIGEYYYLIYGIVDKERFILFPVADGLLGDDTRDSLLEECFDIGYAFIAPTPPALSTKAKTEADDGRFTSRTGTLDFDQLEGLLNHLPLDITFVDTDDKVRYFNETGERHFPRSSSVIGRLVEHCHPPKSVDTVVKIVEAFKRGEQSVATFWIRFKERFLFIRYVAVRDTEGNYLGVLETSQDVTDVRELQGERRLLTWEDDA